MKSNYFKFEKGMYDIPFYNHNPTLTRKSWLILLISLIISAIVYGNLVNSSQVFSSIIASLIIFGTIMYISKNNYNLLFHQLSNDEITISLLLGIGCFIYYLLINNLLYLGNMSFSLLNFNIFTIINNLFFSLYEQLFIVVGIIILMVFSYNYCYNRKVSIIFSSIIMALIYGMICMNSSTPLLNVILIYVLGSFFNIFAYIKTKNYLVCFLVRFIFLLLSSCYYVGY